MLGPHEHGHRSNADAVAGDAVGADRGGDRVVCRLRADAILPGPGDAGGGADVHDALGVGADDGIAFAIFAAFPAFVEIRAQQGAIFNNLVPEVGDQVRSTSTTSAMWRT